MDNRDGMSADQDKYAAGTDAASAEVESPPQDDPIGGSGAVVGDRLDDQHGAQDELIGDEDLAAPVSEPGTPTPNPGPGGSTP